MEVAMVLLELVVRLMEDDGRRKRLGNLFWEVRSVIKKQIRNNRKRKKIKNQRFNFHYDALSYALNFDDTASFLLLNPSPDIHKKKL